MFKQFADNLIADFPLYVYLALSVWFSFHFFRQRRREQAEWRAHAEALERRLVARLDCIAAMLAESELESHHKTASSSRGH